MSKMLEKLQNVAKNRIKYLSMPLDEKRKLYKCKEKYITIEKLIKWPEYFEKNELKYENLNNCSVTNPGLNDKISIFEGDITTLEIDAIVNAANNSLLGGGGVDGAIHRAAGPLLIQECKTLGGCSTGAAKITSGYNLPAKYVIHTVGPIGEKPELLRNCYRNCLDIARENNCRTIAFPCISTGIYGYPHEKASIVALNEIRNYIDQHSDSFDLIIFCLFMEKSKQVYDRFLPKFFPLRTNLNINNQTESN
ncbi:O-acetyl-ADP-ribose deacetylase MACROD2-like [Brachionus plicatilis]|uniref:O-acetyl-ADP-ribose deacetylase MACROD2-like n=1 Tax=Brachionus plicatilis TaxID=10195 RepID=A0A3M7QVE3_BRAPC|nr:O-acetyl-ADP-ribose deacetylase MACROD2-like [Brachionus plicatilis]